MLYAKLMLWIYMTASLAGGPLEKPSSPLVHKFTINNPSDVGTSLDRVVLGPPSTEYMTFPGTQSIW